MNKKIVYLFVIVFSLLVMSATSSFAITALPQNAENISVDVNEAEIETKEMSILKRIGLRDKFKRSPEAQIQSFFKKYTKYSEKNEIDKLKELYSDVYVNNDGFTKNTLFEVMKQASEAYKDVEYNTEILSISVNGSYATVKLHEIATGETSQKATQLNDYGFICSDLYFTNHLRKEDGKWKIIASQIETEQVALKYGEAKNMKVNIQAPQVVPEGSEYEVSVRVDAPDGVLIVGSIVNELIKFPQVQAKDVLRAIKYEELARILKSNKENYNEYATVSLGLTRPRIEPPSVVIDMTGMAIVMSRVNVLPANAVNIKEIKDGEKSTSTPASEK